MVGYFALKTPLKMCVTQKTRRLLIFPSISHFEGIGQGGISREIPPGKYRPGISRTTLVNSALFVPFTVLITSALFVPFTALITSALFVPFTVLITSALFVPFTALIVPFFFRSPC